MRRAFLILVSIIIASIMMISKGDWYSEWARNYRPIFDIDGTGQPQNCVWVFQSYDYELETLYEMNEQLVFDLLDEERPGWREDLVRDTCYNWLTPARKLIHGHNFNEMKSYSTKSKDTTNFYVLDLLGPIWSIEKDWPCLIADFSLREGEIFRPQCRIYGSADRVLLGWSNEYVVLREDSIEVRGTRYRRLLIGGLDNKDVVLNRWVEGIGWQNGDLPGRILHNRNLPNTQFIAKYENGNIVFTYDDFEAPAVGSSDVKQNLIDIEESRKRDKRMYDLQGREIKKPKPGQVYIKGGKAYMAPKDMRR